MSVAAGVLRRRLLASTVCAIASVAVSCASPPPLPSVPAAQAEITQAFAVARRAYERGEFAQAQALYRQALRRARAIDAAALAADAAYNLAVSEIALRHYAAADQLLREAAYDAARAATDLTEIGLLQAKLAYLRGRPAEALALVDALVAAAAAPRIHLQGRILRGQIQADGGDLVAAFAELGAVRDLAAGPAGPLSAALAADTAKLEGSIARRDGQVLTAAQLFDSEAELLRRAHRYRDMGYAFARAAEAYLAAGEAALAADRYFLAARSLDGMGDAAAARPYLDSSVAAADRAGDDGTGARARALLDEISRRAAP